MNYFTIYGPKNRQKDESHLIYYFGKNYINMNVNIKLPPKKGFEAEQYELGFEQLVVVRANGSGKTRLGGWIEEHNYEKVHRISAQKSLSMPSSVSTKSIEIAKEDLLYGMHCDDKNWLKVHGRRGSRWNNKTPAR